MLKLRASFVAVLSLGLMIQNALPGQDTSALFEHLKAATVVILTGEGAGRLRSIGTGVMLSKDGVILTAFHVIKGAAEVQVRTADGETFDHVELLGVDERRDVAALKVPARELASLSQGTNLRLSQGDPVYAVTNANGLTWSATSGILSAVRPADEIPGAGRGFRVVQFTAPIDPGSSGGALVDRDGALIGIITGGSGSAGLAVPIENVAGLPESGHSSNLGSGGLLQMPAKLAESSPQSSAGVAGADPNEIIRNARTIAIRSKTLFLTVDTVDRALSRQKDWPKLGLTIVTDLRLADLLVEIDRPLFTYVHTFVVSDKKTSIVLASGEVTAFDGTIASGGIAKDIVKALAAVRLGAPGKK